MLFSYYVCYLEICSVSLLQKFFLFGHFITIFVSILPKFKQLIITSLLPTFNCKNLNIFPIIFYLKKHVSAQTGSYYPHKYFVTAYRSNFLLPFSIHNYSRILYLLFLSQ